MWLLSVLVLIVACILMTYVMSRCYRVRRQIRTSSMDEQAAVAAQNRTVRTVSRDQCRTSVSVYIASMICVRPYPQIYFEGVFPLSLSSLFFIFFSNFPFFLAPQIRLRDLGSVSCSGMGGGEKHLQPPDTFPGL